MNINKWLEKAYNASYNGSKIVKFCQLYRDKKTFGHNWLSFGSPGAVRWGRPRWRCLCRCPERWGSSPRPCHRRRRRPRTHSRHWTRSSSSCASSPPAHEPSHCPATAWAAPPSSWGRSWTWSRETWSEEHYHHLDTTQLTTGAQAQAVTGQTHKWQAGLLRVLTGLAQAGC